MQNWLLSSTLATTESQSCTSTMLATDVCQQRFQIIMQKQQTTAHFLRCQGSLPERHCRKIHPQSARVSKEATTPCKLTMAIGHASLFVALRRATKCHGHAQLSTRALGWNVAFGAIFGHQGWHTLRTLHTFGCSVFALATNWQVAIHCQSGHHAPG